MQLESFRTRASSVTVSESQRGRAILPQQSASPLHQLGPKFQRLCEIALGTGIAGILLVRFLCRAGVKRIGVLVLNFLTWRVRSGLDNPGIQLYEKQSNRSSLPRAAALVEFSVRCDVVTFSA